MEHRDKLLTVLNYCTRRNFPCWITYTKPEWRNMGGITNRLIDLTADTATIEAANGDRKTVPLAHVTL